MAGTRRRRGPLVTAGAVGVAMALAACGSSSSDSGSSPAASGAAGGASVSADCAPYAEFGKFEGKTVNIFSPIRDDGQKDQEAAQKKFEQCTGITIKWEGTGEFETQLPLRIQGGNAPDLATIPQPGLLGTLVGKNAVKPLPEKLQAVAKEAYSADWLKYGTVNGTLYAAPLGANVKSFVWYSPATFKENGWQIPQTWADLLKLTDTIAASGKMKPWCAGFESGVATGWPGTDWIEDIMLRTAGPEVYDKWTTHGIPFNDPSVVAAFDEAGKILKNDKYVNGGYGSSKTIATTSFQDGGLPIADGQCAMHRQASFYSGSWEKGTKIAEDGDIFAFYLPPVDPAKGKPVLGGGEVVAAFNDKPESQAVQAYYMSAQHQSDRAKIGDWISPHKQLKKEDVVTRGTTDPNPILQLSVDILQDPKAVFRFDGSDLMPSAVGAGTFWKGMTKWVSGADTKAVTDEIEASWPKS